ncbi:unnamed protein product [Ixodes persulcatus]
MECAILFYYQSSPVQGPCGVARAAHHTRESHLRPCHSATDITLPCQGRTPYGAERTCPRRGLSLYSMPHNYRAMKRQLARWFPNA